MKKALATVNENIIPIVASSDDNYAYPLGVMFISLLENTRAPERFHLFVVDGGIRSQKKQQLTDSVNQYNSQLTFLNVNSDLYANFPTSAHISAPAYYRISIPELFDTSVERVIYLDCDLVIKADLQALWQQTLDGYAVGAVENISSSTYRASGLDQQDYFNSGVLLIDLQRWREQRIPEKIRAFKQEHPELICTNDQCALNGVFRGDWKRLPLHWNHQSGLFRSSKQVKRLKLHADFEKSLWSPNIIHYIGWSKPWLMPCYHPLAGEYRRYRKLSNFMADHPIETHTDIGERSGFSLWKKRMRQLLWQWRYRQHGYEIYSID